MQFQCWQSIYWIDSRPVTYRSGRHECDYHWNSLPPTGWLGTRIWYAANRSDVLHGNNWIVRTDRDVWEGREEEPVDFNRCHYKEGVLLRDNVWETIYRMIHRLEFDLD